MKRRISSLICILVLCLMTWSPAWVAADTIPAERLLPRLVDNADLLTDTEESNLLGRLDQISETQQCDVVIVTTNSLDGKSSTQYADDFFDYNGYGMGTDYSGILLLISMEDRDWAMSTHGFGIDAFTDAGLEYLEDQFLTDLSNGYYVDSFTAYANTCDDMLRQARNGKPYDYNNMPKEPFSLMWIPIALFGGAVISFIVVGVMKAELKSVRKQAAANNYVRQGSLNITESRDTYLYRKVDKREKPKNNGGGGSSTHRSSSGRSHGGSSGKF